MIFHIFTGKTFLIVNNDDDNFFSTQVDLLTDIAHSPRILTNFASAIQPASFKKVQFNVLDPHKT